MCVMVKKGDVCGGWGGVVGASQWRSLRWCAPALCGRSFHTDRTSGTWRADEREGALGSALCPVQVAGVIRALRDEGQRRSAAGTMRPSVLPRAAAGGRCSAERSGAERG